MKPDTEFDNNEPTPGFDLVWQVVAARFRLSLLGCEDGAVVSGEVDGTSVRAVSSLKGDAVLTIGEGSESDGVPASNDLALLHEILTTPVERRLAGSAFTEGWALDCGQWRKWISITASANDVEALIKRGLEFAHALSHVPRTRAELLTELTSGHQGVVRVPHDRARRLELILDSFPSEPATRETLLHLRDDPSDAVRCIVARELGDATTLSLLIRMTADRHVRQAAIDALFSLPPDSWTHEALDGYADWVVDLAQGKVSIPDVHVAHVAETLSMLPVPKQRTVARLCLAATAHGLRLLALAAASILAEAGTAQDLDLLKEREEYWIRAQPTPVGPWQAVIVAEQQLAEAARHAIERITSRVELGT